MASMTIHELLCEHLTSDLAEIVLDCLRPSREYWRWHMSLILCRLPKGYRVEDLREMRYKKKPIVGPKGQIGYNYPIWRTFIGGLIRP
jgi:hypothetical protein